MFVCENYRVPSFEVHGGLNPQVLAAMEGSCLKSPGLRTKDAPRMPGQPKESIL